jgi:hypothetical protein
MATDVQLFKSGVPAYLKAQELDNVTKSLLGSGAGQSAKRISIRGGVFRMVVDGKEIASNEERSMKVVVINVAPDVSRKFFAGAYDANVKASPSCWSANGNTPDKSIASPQSSSCATCEQNIKGSGSNNTRACKFERRIAVVLENDLGGDLFQLSLPAQSIFGKGEDGKLPLNAYATFLAGFNVNVTAVVTEMRFDTNSATPKLVFKAARPLTEEEYESCRERGQSDEAVAAVKVSYSASVDVAQPKTPRLSKVMEAAPEEDEPAAAPTKRASKKEEAPVPKKNLADVLNAWDDEE